MTPPAPRSRGAEVKDELQVYLNDIIRYPLLTAEEERELGWKILNKTAPSPGRG